MLDYAEMVKRAVLHLLASRLPFYGLYLYRVREQNGSTLVCEAQTPVDGLCSILDVEAVHGVAGASEQHAPGAVVLIGFQGGKPSAPYIAAWVAGMPVSVKLDAQTTITLGGSSAGFVALASLVASELGKIATSITQLATYVNAIAPGTVTPYTQGSVAAVKVKAE